MLSDTAAAGVQEADAQLVRLIHGDTQPGGPGFAEGEVPSDANGTYPISEQTTHHGSVARIPCRPGILPAAGTALSLFAMVRPSGGEGRQPVMTVWDAAAETGIALVLEPGLRLAFWTTAGSGVQRVAA